MLQPIDRVYYQVSSSSRVDENIKSDILLKDNGWIVGNENEEVCPLWCNGTFLISFLLFRRCHQI